MVKVTESDLSDKELLEFMSEDSDNGDETLLNKKYGQKEALITLEVNFPKVVTILGIPKVEEAKHDKLAEVLKKLIIKHFDNNINDDSISNIKIYMPKDEKKYTKGICFLTFNDSFVANKAAKILNKLKLDVKHVLIASKMDDIESILNRDERTMSINVVGFTRENLRWWLNDERCREQFIVRYNTYLDVNWFDPLETEPELIYSSLNKTAPFTNVQWSDQGSYLVTYHNSSVVLWGNKSFDKLIRLSHKGVKEISFSPNENYILTWDGTPASSNNDKAICIWRVITGKLLRSFLTPEYNSKERTFPQFLWSYDDKYIACIGKQRELYIYELPSMLLIENSEKKRIPLKYSTVYEFDWSPINNIVSIWIPSTSPDPGTFVLVEIPSRRELVSRIIYDAEVATIHWQSKGEYLCLKVTICKKKKKKVKKEYTQLEIFHMKEKDIPIDTIQIEGIKAKQFHWEEGNTKRFALIVKDESTNRQQIRFYKINKSGSNTNSVWTTTFDINNQMNFMKWSPQGKFFILASLGTEGTLYFCSCTDNDEVEVIHKDEHLYVNQISWSGCGRYLVTSVAVHPNDASVKLKEEHNEAGFYIWTFQGKCLMRIKKPSFWQFAFRPHPKTIIDEERKMEIKKNLKELSKKFDSIDAKIKNNKKNALIAKRKAIESAFNEKLKKVIEAFQACTEYEQYKKDWEIFESHFKWEEKTIIYEQILSVKQELIA